MCVKGIKLRRELRDGGEKGVEKNGVCFVIEDPLIFIIYKGDKRTVKSFLECGILLVFE